MGCTVALCQSEFQTSWHVSGEGQLRAPPRVQCACGGHTHVSVGSSNHSSLAAVAQDVRGSRDDHVCKHRDTLRTTLQVASHASLVSLLDAVRCIKYIRAQSS